MFNKSTETSITQKSINGFTMSANIAATYGLSSEFDALVLTLCNFSTLLNVPAELGDIQVNVTYGQNLKAQSATKTVFGLVQKHGDCMRESWKNIFEVLGQLFKLKLLPKSLIEVDDFCKPNGKLLLVAERIITQKSDVGLFSSLYSYLSSDNQRQPSYEEQEVIKVSKKCIRECKIDQIINESKFLQFDSLQELLRCLAGNLKPPTSYKERERYEEDLVVFMLETMIRILIQNRDRLLPIWDNCKDPLYQLLYNDGKNYGYEYLLVRTTVGILKLSAFLMRNEELCPVVLLSLKIILKFKSVTMLKLSRPISIGMYELLKTSAQNIHSEADWGIVFSILECVGAGAVQREYEEEIQQRAQSDGALSSEEDSGLADRGYTSDSEVIQSTSLASTPLVSPSSNENWILVNDETSETLSQSPVKENSLVYPCKLIEHSPFALVKCWDSLAFIVRNVAHITPYNFEGCVRCIRTFVEASINGGPKLNRKHSFNTELQRQRQIKKENKDRKRVQNNNGDDQSSEGEAELENLSDRYPTIAIQLLDLMHTLHTRTAQIFRWWAEEGGAVPQCSTLWAQGWCPLLQGIARLATDQRRNVRTSAITCLQRALLVHDLQALSGPEWAGCFKQVLFPLLSNLLSEKISPIDPSLLEESRMRSATIMSKVFLHHLTPLITLAKFSELWLEILDYLERFMKIGSDMLYEAMLESLKNILLVMHSVRVFHSSDGVSQALCGTLRGTR